MIDRPEATGRVKKSKDEWTRRPLDRSQRIRYAIQAGFLLLNLALGAQFVWFVRALEQGGTSPVERPPGVEGWLPIAGLMNARYLVLTGEWPTVHPAAAVLLLTFVGLSVVFRRSFCSWICPVGTLSEWLWKAGRSIFRRNWALPKWLDLPLRGLKYLLLAFFLWAIGGMTAASIGDFLQSPYGLIADVKMLNFFRYLSATGAGVIAVLAIGSVFVKNFWCRYLCPYGALMGLASLFSPARIRRTPEACIDCAKCAKVCPSNLPVDRLIQIRSAECLGCLECVAICPAEGALHLTVARRPWPLRKVAWGVVGIFVLAVGLAKWTGHWHSAIPDATYRRLIPMADELDHPR